MAEPRRSRSPTFQPRFTLGLFYLFAFFILYCLILVAPELYEVARSLPPGSEQQQAAEQAAREAIRPRLPIAIAAAVLTTVLGGRRGLLPGLRPRA